ncbi:MAG: hypothetical protein RSA40_02640 [Malacoplasma sp.]
MIKLESIIKNDKKNIEVSPLTLSIDNEKFNYIYSDKQEELDDIFSIMSGFYQTKLGHIIYDDFNFNEMLFKDRSLFIKNNLEIITPFSNIDRNKTIYSLIKRHMIFCDLIFKDYRIVIMELLAKFNIEQLAYEKLKSLSNDNILVFHMLLATIKEPKYIFIYNFEKYISNDLSLIKFLEDLKIHLPKNSTFVFFSNKNILDKKNFDFFDLTKKNASNKNILFVRNKTFVNEKKFTKNIFYICKEIIGYSKWLILSLLLLQCLLLSMFFIANITNFKIDTNNNFVYRFKQIRIISIFLIFILNLSFITIFLFHNNYLIYKMTRSGQNIFKLIFIYVLIYALFFIMGFLISLLYPLIVFSNGINDFNWLEAILIPLSSFAVSSFLFLVLFIFNNKKILRKNTDFV